MIDEQTRLSQIKRQLIHALTTESESKPTVTRRAPRQVRLFPTETLVTFTTDETNSRTVMEMVTGDRPGLLCEVGEVMRDKLIVIQTAKVLTVGERAEDVFYITTDDGQPLSEAQCNELKEAIIDALGQSG